MLLGETFEKGEATKTWILKLFYTKNVNSSSLFPFLKWTQISILQKTPNHSAYLSATHQKDVK